MWQPGWEGSLGENGSTCMYGWITLLFTWKYHNIVNWLYTQMVGWHHWLNGHDFEQTLGDSEGQGSLVCDSPWGCKESLDLKIRASLIPQMVKNLSSMSKTWAQSLGWEDPLEESMETHCSILAWKSPWAKEAGGLQPMESHRVRRNWATKHTK